MPQGFTVSVYTRPGSPYWYARCYLDGGGDKPLRWSTGVRLDSEGGKRGSRRVAQGRAEDEARRLASAAVADQAAADDTSLAEVAKRFLRQKKADGRRPRALRQHASNLQTHVLPFFGAERDVRTIRRPDLEAFKRHLRAGELAPVTINNNLTSIRQILKHAAIVEEMDGFESMPIVTNVKVSQESKGRALTPDQVGALLSEVNPRELEALQFLAFIANTGTRRTETFEMRWGWIDWDNSMLRIPAEYRKGGASRRGVPLNDVALAILRARQEHGTKYTGRRKDPLPTGPEDRVWLQKKHDEARNAAAKRAGLGKIRNHDLRHTFGSLAHASGASLPEVRDLLGHTTLAMVNRYAHSYEEKLREASQRVQLGGGASVLGRVLGGGSNPAQKGPAPTQRRLRAVK